MTNGLGIGSSQNIKSGTAITHTNVQRVVIAAEAVYESLFGGCLFSDDPIWLAVVGNWFCLGRTGDNLGELFSICFGAKVETRALTNRM